MKKNLDFCFLAFFWLLFCFFLHRIFTQAYLSEHGVELESSRQLVIFAVGFLSDVWVAMLGALLCGFLGLIFVLSDRWARRTQFGYLILLACFIALHQAYVEFFGYQIIPGHLKYFFDFNFVGANRDTAFNPRAAITLLLAGVFLFIFWRLIFRKLLANNSTKKWGTKYWIGGFVIVLCALLAHAGNIRARVQLFVPEKLQTNFFERLYLNSKIAADPIAPTKEQLELVSKNLGKPASQGRDDFSALLSWEVRSDTLDKTGKSIKKSFDKRRQAGKKPLIIVVLLESARPSEFGAYHLDPKHNVTPFFDDLVANGILFKKAFSTGIVTRGAQEATLCGYLGSQNTSMMRERADVQINCLPRRLKAVGESFWFHGGKAEFDGQKSFWRSQGVEHLITFEDFPSQTPSTGWGVGDLSLFRKSAQTLAKIHAETSKEFVFGEILTVTNHIPWRLPDDANLDKSLLKDMRRGHRSYLTTAYTDIALGLFVQLMKDEGLWEESLIIAVGDHGNTIPPLNIDKEISQHWNEIALSHVVLGMFGGIVSEALASIHSVHVTEGGFVSQADIAPFIGYLGGLEGQDFLSESLFVKPRLSPIIADLGDQAFFPKLGSRISRRVLLEEKRLSEDEDTKQAILYYRSFLLFLNNLGLGKVNPDLKE